MAFIENRIGAFCYMTAPNITVAHAFTTRYGGVSRGVYASLNLGLNRGDDSESVRENYALLCRALGITEDGIVCSRQVHGTDIRVVTREDTGRLYEPELYEADGLMTCDLGVALTVFTADCVPILLHDSTRGVIAAVHAGWRGTVADIAGKAVARMESEFGCSPSDITAAIGPCISKCCFETGPEVERALRETLGADAEKCAERRGGKFMVDLKETNRLLLTVAGMREEKIEVSNECTSCRSEKYWSHRRTNGVRGSQASIIVMKGNAPR